QHRVGVQPDGYLQQVDRVVLVVPPAAHDRGRPPDQQQGQRHQAGVGAQAGDQQQQAGEGGPESRQEGDAGGGPGGVVDGPAGAEQGRQVGEGGQPEGGVEG